MLLIALNVVLAMSGTTVLAGLLNRAAPGPVDPIGFGVESPGMAEAPQPNLPPGPAIPVSPDPVSLVGVASVGDGEGDGDDDYVGADDGDDADETGGPGSPSGGSSSTVTSITSLQTTTTTNADDDSPSDDPADDEDDADDEDEKSSGRR